MATYRSLAETNYKLSKRAPIIEKTLLDLLKKENALKVLEIGFGRGRTLLELARRFRNGRVSFFGVDKRQELPLEKRENLRGMARQFAIVSEAELAGFELPEIFFYDATRLHFDDENIDLIYSVMTVRFIERKAEFLEEVCRILKPGGVALLQIGEADWRYPYSLMCDNKLLTPFTNRFVLKYGNELIPLPEYLKLFEGDAFRFGFINRPRCVMRIDKLKPGRLRLQLEFNQKLGLPMEELPYLHGSGKVRGGFRSVYDVRPEIYRALFERGLLSRDQLRTDIKFTDDSQLKTAHEED